MPRDIQCVMNGKHLSCVKCHFQGEGWECVGILIFVSSLVLILFCIWHSPCDFQIIYLLKQIVERCCEHHFLNVYFEGSECFNEKRVEELLEY